MGESPRRRRGIIFVLSAPSGAGKTTILREALHAIPGLEHLVTLTTRAPREGEVEGEDHFFVSREEFKRRVEAAELAEWDEHFGGFYGTPRPPLEAAVAEGRDVLLEIDIKGARAIRKQMRRDAVTVFILPPSFAELQRRLRDRASEDPALIELRLMRA